MTARRTGRAAIYARVSTRDQNAHMQVREARELVARRGWTLVETYEDAGVSGKRSSRPALDRALVDARRRRFDVFIVWKTDRAFRSLVHLVQFIAELKAIGVSFVSVTEPFDDESPSGRAMMQMLGVLAEFERECMLERTHAGIAAARARGVHLGRKARRIDGLELAPHLIAFGVSERDCARMLEVPRSTLKSRTTKREAA